MYVTARFSTLRAVVGQKEPVILEVIFKNTEPNSVLTSILIKVPFALGFDRAGLMRECRKRIGYVKSGEERAIPLPLYLKSTSTEGSYPIEITAQVHDNDKYDKVKSEYGYATSLRVIRT